MADAFTQPLQIIFNADGSINELVVGTSIQQGDNETKQIFTKIIGVSNSDYTCSGDFLLPDGTVSEVVAETDDDGYSITLTEAQTLYAGNIKLSLKLIDLQSHVLCTYQVTLKINPTSYNPNTTNITEAQYNSLLQSLNSYALKSVAALLGRAQTFTKKQTFKPDNVDDDAINIEFSNDDAFAIFIKSINQSHGYNIGLEATAPAADRDIELPNESGVLATRNYAKGLFSPTLVDTKTSIENANSAIEEGNYKGFIFSIPYGDGSNDDVNGFYILTFAYCMILLPMYNPTFNGIYKTSACVFNATTGSYEIKVITYAWNGAEHQLHVYNKNNVIGTGYTGYLFKIKLY